MKRDFSSFFDPPSWQEAIGGHCDLRSWSAALRHALAELTKFHGNFIAPRRQLG
jgi:hypothetical protein